MPYRLPSADQKAHYVRTRFDAIAHRYDRFNDLITQGQHRWWKRTLVRRLALRPNDRVLDLCCGTGDLALRCRERLGPRGAVIAADFALNMLAVARRRLAGSASAAGSAAKAVPGGAARAWLICADATRLPFPDECFRVATIGYGLRNVADLGACLGELWRVLAPGGVLASLDVGKVRAAWLRPLVNAYFFLVVPWIGRLLQPGEEMYSYLPHSSIDYPHQERLLALLADRGFEHIELIEYLGGASVIHIARKPQWVHFIENS
jgi:demethylmenaquinone methyltransferase/2-methoxy-6-polyprenyl-1,4-benzoquinol methylase